MTTSGFSLNHAVCACGTLRGVALLSRSPSPISPPRAQSPQRHLPSPAHHLIIPVSRTHPHIHTRIRCVPALLLSHFALPFINAAPFHARFLAPRWPACSSVAIFTSLSFCVTVCRGRIFCSWWRFGVLWTCWSSLLVSISVALR